MPSVEQPKITRESVDAQLGEKPAPHKIGVIALSSDMVTERDFSLMLPPGGDVMYYTARVPLTLPVTTENLRLMGPMLSEAASLILPTSRLDVIAYSCTSASVLIGPEEVTAQIHKGRPGINVVTPITAALIAFETCNVKKISLLTPYTEDVTIAMAKFIESQGIEILNFSHLDMIDDQEMARLTPTGIHDLAVAIAHNDADAVFISCTGIRTVETISLLEGTLGKPVFSSNQCMFWHALRLAGYVKSIAGFGRLLTH